MEMVFSLLQIVMEVVTLLTGANYTKLMIFSNDFLTKTLQHCNYS